MKLIFMGTPDFAVPVLKTLNESEHEIVGVYTQPDKETGRGKKTSYSPVKIYALENGLPVFQPKGFKKETVLEEMRALHADAIIVAAYGKILRLPVLRMTKYGCLNVHASLLPSYRGAAPIQWAILDGRKETGITIMQMDEGLDTGDILLQEKTEITETETGDSLFEKLSLLGGPMMLKVLADLETGDLRPVPQGESDTPYAKMLEKDMGKLDFREPAELLERKIRAFYSWPSAYTSRLGKKYKILRARVVPENGAPGEVLSVTKKSFTIGTGFGGLEILRIQPEGKKAMDTDAFLRGTKITVTDRFGEE